MSSGTYLNKRDGEYRTNACRAVARLDKPALIEKLEDLLLIVELPAEDHRNLVSEVDERGKRVDESERGAGLSVARADEGDPEEDGLVVDVLQLLQRFQAFQILQRQGK